MNEASFQRLLDVAVLRVYDKVWMVNRLPQPDQDVKNMGVVVKHGPALHVGVELGLALRVQRLIEVVLEFVEPLSSNSHQSRRQLDVLRASGLGATEHGTV